MIITEAQHSHRHIPSADSVNPIHGGGVYALIRKVCMSEGIRIRPFVERWLISQCRVKMQVIVGLPSAMQHVFCERVRRIASFRARL